MIIMPNFKEPEAEVWLTINCFKVNLLELLHIEEMDKEATRLLPCFPPTSTSSRPTSGLVC